MLTTEGTSRLMAFADAVVAIAITLLVLPLVDIPTEVSTTSLAEVWADHSNQLVMFLLSFAVIARLWLTHHDLGERMGRADSFTLITTLPWLLTVVFLPFPTQMLGQLGNTRPVAALYIATLAVNITVVAVQGFRLSRRPAMWREGLNAEQMKHWSIGWLSNPLLAGLALILCLVFPKLGVWALMVLFLDPILTRLIERGAGLDPKLLRAERAAGANAVDYARDRADED